jgi:hypothetical protein
MCEVIAYSLVGAAAFYVLGGIANAIFDVNGTRATLREQAEEAALSNPNSPQSQKLREEIDQLLSK